LHQVDIRRAFGLARRAHAYFVQFPSEGTEA